MLENSKNNLSNANDINAIKGKNNGLTITKNKDEISKYLKDEGIEVVDFLDFGSESNVYHISVLSKNRNRKNEKKDAIMKLIVDKRKSKNKEIYISKILKNKNIIDCYTNSILDQANLSFLITEYAKYGNLRNFNQKF